MLHVPIPPRAAGAADAELRTALLRLLRAAVLVGGTALLPRLRSTGQDACMTEPPTGAVALPDGTVVRGRGRREPLPSGPLPDFGLYLGRRPDQQRRAVLRRSAPWRPGWPADWIDWPDFRTPRDDRTAATLIGRAYLLARDGQRVEIACEGGTGRTGTVIACLAILSGHPADDAIAWTRRNYRPRAGETPGQRRWVAWFYKHYGASTNGAPAQVRQ